MKFTTAILSVAVAALAFTEAAPAAGHAGHEIPLVRNEKHIKNFRSAMAKLAHRYPQLGLAVPTAGPIHDDAAAKTGAVPLTDVGPDSE
ncbi:hypothetical protein BGZ49_003229, partial [Haplosporangium sp. Z 27]